MKKRKDRKIHWLQEEITLKLKCLFGQISLKEIQISKMPSEIIQFSPVPREEEITIIYFLSILYMPGAVGTFAMDSCFKNKIQRNKMRKMVF